jgi:Tetratricopeptide repeat
VLGAEHPSTLDSMDNLAVVLNRQGKHAEAEEIQRQTLRLYTKVLGAEHPSTLRSMNNLVDALRQQGKHEEAENMHLR